MKYFIEETDIEVPTELRDKIIEDYLTKTYYVTVGFGSLIIGFLLGVLAAR